MSNALRILFLSLVLPWVLSLAACGGGGGSAERPALQVQVEVLGTGVHAGRYNYERIKIRREGAAPAYGIWFPPPRLSAGEKGPAVLLSDPYGGIDWTGEPVDSAARALAGGDGFVMLADDHGPPHPDGLRLYVPYDHSPIEVAGGGALAYLANGIGVLVLYQRMYAGGDLQDDIDDTLSGLTFLAQAEQVDRRRVAAWGSSYGGSLVLYAMAQAPAVQRPAWAALATPIVDFEQFCTYADWLAAVHTDAGQALLRLQPFALRARWAARRADSPDGLARYATAPLQANQDTKILFLHDLFDTIAPLLHASALYFGAPGRHQVFVYPHQGAPLDWARLEVAHAPVRPGFDEASAVLFSQAHLLLRLQADAPVVLLPRLGDVEALFPYLRQQQQAGADLNTSLRPRLLELCDPRLSIVRYEDDFQSRESGREFVAQMLSKHWGYDVNADQVVEFLIGHGL